MAPAQRIIYWQAGIVFGSAVLIPGVAFLLGEGFSCLTAVGEWSRRFASMLMGGLSVVVPGWGYLAVTSGEHRGERLLLLAWLKIVGTIVLLAISMLLAPRPIWLLGGLAIAYLGHALAAFREH